MAQHRRRRRRRRRCKPLTVIFVALVGVAAIWCVGSSLGDFVGIGRVKRLEKADVPSWVIGRLLPVGNARSGRRLENVSDIVIHYVGNPNTTAMANRNYFAMEETTVCSHFVVGLDGEVIQCLPLWERSAASNHRNRDTISIEVCHPDESGKFSDETYASLIRLTAWLCEVGGLDEKDVIRHYDVSGKECPLYYARHEEAWEQLRADVAARLN